MADKKIKKEGGKADISNYEVPDNVVKIQPGDTGYALVKKNYNRFIWTWNQYAGKDKIGEEKVENTIGEVNEKKKEISEQDGGMNSHGISTPGSVPGMGAPTPPTATTPGSGDVFVPNLVGLKSYKPLKKKKKKKKKSRLKRMKHLREYESFKEELKIKSQS